MGKSRRGGRLTLDGVFDSYGSEKRADFHFTGNPTPTEIARLLAKVRHRIERLLDRRGLHPAAEDPADDASEQDPELAACLHQAVLDRQRSLSRRNGDQKRVRPKTNSPQRLLARDRGQQLVAKVLRRRGERISVLPGPWGDGSRFAING